MKANEFRLGSFFGYEGCIYAANVIRDNFVYGINVNGSASGEFPLDKIKPIQLTEEWLLKFGLLKTIECSFLLGSYELVKYENSYRVLLPKNGILSTIKYVHELQNLYFSLTGEELTIKI